MQRSMLLAVAMCLGPFVGESSLVAQDVDGDPALVRGPYLQNLFPDSVEIVWVTVGIDGPATVRVDGGLDGPRIFEQGEVDSCDALLDDRPDARCHRVRLELLTPGGDHEYRIFVGDVDLAVDGGQVFDVPLRFRTPPAGDEAVLRLAALGDSGAATPVQLLVGQVMADLEPLGVLHTGDVDYLRDPDRTVFGPYRELMTRACLFPARGDHDLAIPFGSYFFVPGELRGVERTYFSFDWGPAHFLVIDSTMSFDAGEPGEEQIAFVRRDLAAARAANRPWIIATIHSPPFTTGPHSVEPHTMVLRNLFAPLFDEFDVDLVLSGDDHFYSRSSPLRILDERCPELDNLRCVESEIPFCYEIVAAEQRPHYASPGGTVYVITGGGGNIPYREYVPRGEAAECHFVDTAFRELVNSRPHCLELEISPVMIRSRAWDLVGDPLDEFSLQRIRVLRGDMDLSGDLDLGDAIAILGSLFLGQAVPCPQAGNVDGGAAVDIADAVYLLNYLFLGGAAPVAPFPECGLLMEATAGFCERGGC